MAYYVYRLVEMELRALEAARPSTSPKCGDEHYSVIANRILRSTNDLVFDRLGQRKVGGKPKAVP